MEYSKITGDVFIDLFLYHMILIISTMDKDKRLDSEKQPKKFIGLFNGTFLHLILRLKEIGLDTQDENALLSYQQGLGRACRNMEDDQKDFQHKTAQLENYLKNLGIYPPPT